jgi:hypothetical protein
MNETIEQQTKDSDTIFTAISTAGFDDFKQAQQAVTMMYVMDMSFSRSGISHALKRLEEHYKTMDDPFTEEEQRFNDALDDHSVAEEERAATRAVDIRRLKRLSWLTAFALASLVGLLLTVGIPE